MHNKKLKIKIKKSWIYSINKLINKILKKKKKEKLDNKINKDLVKWVKKENIIKLVIKIKKNLNITLTQDCKINNKIKIILSKKTKLNNYVIWYRNINNSIKYIINKDSELNTNFILVWNKKNIKYKIKTINKWDKSSSNINILSFVKNEWSINLNSWVKIIKNIKKSKWYISQTNIFLWDSWTIQWIPSLFVRSNDVEAGHSARIEKINEEKKFYLEAHWLDSNSATAMMISWLIKTSLKSLSNVSKENCSKLFWKIEKAIIK